MLENPTFGWCGVTIGSWHISNASYLEDYPISFSDAFLWAAGREKGHDFYLDPQDPGRCLVKVDCEGDWWTVEVGKGFLRVWHWDAGEEQVISLDADEAFWRSMCAELADDIEGCIHEWTMWGTDASASVDENDGDYGKAADYQKRKRELESLIGELRRA